MVFTVICYPYHDNTEGSVPCIMITPAYLLRNSQVFHLFVPEHIPVHRLCTYAVPLQKHVWLEWPHLKKLPLRLKAHSLCSAVLAGAWWLPRRKQRNSLRSFAASQRGHYTAVLQGSDTKGSLLPPYQISLSLSCIHTTLSTWQIFDFSRHEHKFQVRDTCEGLMVVSPLVRLHPSAAGIHHCVDCRALKATEKIPANFADLL